LRSINYENKDFVVGWGIKESERLRRVNRKGSVSMILGLVLLVYGTVRKGKEKIGVG
jgi:hypothetical protein